MCHLRLTALVLFAAFAGAGCKSIGSDWSRHMPWADSEIKEAERNYQQPVRMVAIWSPAVYNQPGKPPTRGFGGRLYFYNGENVAVPVDGNLVVFAYDDSRAMLDGKAPDRKFAFTPEQFTKHFSETELGASYSVWIPWDAVGSPKAEVSLVPIFTSTKGSRVAAQQSRNFLPGTNDPAPQARMETVTRSPMILRNDTPPVTYASGMGEAAPGYPGQQTSFHHDPQEPQIPGIAPTFQAPSLQTMSIALPSSLTERLAKAPPQMPITRPQSQISLPANAVPATATDAREWSEPSGKVPPPWSPPDPRQARFSRPRSPVPTSPNRQPTAYPPQSQRYPAGQQYFPPGPPESYQPPSGPGAWSGGFETR